MDKAQTPVLAIGIMGKRKDKPGAKEGPTDREQQLVDLAREVRSAKSDDAYAIALSAFVRSALDDDDEGDTAEG